MRKKLEHTPNPLLLKGSAYLRILRVFIELSESRNSACHSLTDLLCGVICKLHNPLNLVDKAFL